MQDRSNLLTEQRLSQSMRLDEISVAECVNLMHQQDQIAVQAVGLVNNDIVRAIDLIVLRLRSGGRLLYFGAGTSGRLGVLDASEIPPTFRAPSELVQGTIAGGNAAMFVAQEGAEDSPAGGAADVDGKRVSEKDVVMGIATGGTTPYVWGALNRAIELKAGTIFLSCVQAVPGEPKVDVVIRPLTGPEVVTGSTRLKAGTATKLILNMLTTISMVQLGKVYENLMVDLRASNEKLRDRSIRIIRTVTNVSTEQAAELLARA
ncbi:MAG TPA: N-acetylmuramic acid 6-phosphate etherase, partial [Tepidisphaeraceae bacterium]|nr:N-acetylmuramic acid 6-phosphate etherase [Tepidisphaeraceae bacterium]